MLFGEGRGEVLLEERGKSLQECTSNANADPQEEAARGAIVSAKGVA